ncbi:hypothetical protein C2E23DRAFT_528540 [Lenzites betulinus]|nr:hypothetical protein C2E23DRAFT_528540 [Lenzites betulinus]
MSPPLRSPSMAVPYIRTLSVRPSARSSIRSSVLSSFRIPPQSSNARYGTLFLYLSYPAAPSSQLAYTTSLPNPTQQHPRPSRHGHLPLPRPPPLNLRTRARGAFTMKIVLAHVRHATTQNPKPETRNIQRPSSKHYSVHLPAPGLSFRLHPRLCSPPSSDYASFLLRILPRTCDPTAPPLPLIPFAPTLRPRSRSPSRM